MDIRKIQKLWSGISNHVRTNTTISSNVICARNYSLWLVRRIRKLVRRIRVPYGNLCSVGGNKCACALKLMHIRMPPTEQIRFENLRRILYVRRVRILHTCLRCLHACYVTKVVSHKWFIFWTMHNNHTITNTHTLKR